MKNIFCLESEWELSKSKKMRDRASMLPLLNFLEQSKGVEYVFRNVASRSDLKYYINQLGYKTYKNFHIIYLAFHGTSKALEIPAEKDNPLFFSELADISNGGFQGKIVHFGSCRTLLTSDERIQGFKEQTGAKLISGYTKNIDFIRSSILDFAYFSELVDIQNVGAIEKRMKKRYDKLMDDLGFKIF